MNRTTHHSTSIGALMAALLACGSAYGGAELRCDTVQFEGATQQSAANTPFVGEMTMNNLLTGESSTASVVTMLLGAVSSDGSRVVTSHEITPQDGSGGTMLTFDDAQLIPQGDGVFTLISHMRVKTGNGAYNCGELVIGGQSTVAFDELGVGSAEYSGFGRVCRCKPSDN